jgi:hypothetical protein
VAEQPTVRELAIKAIDTHVANSCANFFVQLANDRMQAVAKNRGVVQIDMDLNLAQQFDAVLDNLMAARKIAISSVNAKFPSDEPDADGSGKIAVIEAPSG